MDLNTLANVGEFLGGLAILVSLIYLVLSVRQNTAQMRESLRSQRRQEKRAAYEQHDRFRNALLDRDLAELWVKGVAGDSLDDRADRLRFSNLLLMNTYAHQNTWDVGHQGLDQDAGTFNRIAPTLAKLYDSPGVRKWWQRSRVGFDPGFVDAVERHRHHMNDS